MKNDISFIPGELIPRELSEAAEKQIEYPYISDATVREVTNSGEQERKTNSFGEKRIQYKKNYFNFEEHMFNFAKDQLEQKNFDLSEKCFRYLVEMGTKSARTKEYLIKIYRKKKDQKGLVWIKTKINNQLKEPEDFLNQKNKLSKLKEKYF